VPVQGITTFDETRDGHLQSPEFFDAERYPELRFVSTSVTRRGAELVVGGELTIKGVTHAVELHGELAGPTRDPWGSERIGLELAGTIDRTAYGLRWNAPLAGGGFLLADEVTFEASFSAVKA
jgi:polyisoprenoid-binding protein YceI